MFKQNPPKTITDEKGIVWYLPDKERDKRVKEATPKFEYDLTCEAPLYIYGLDHWNTPHVLAQLEVDGLVDHAVRKVGMWACYAESACYVLQHIKDAWEKKDIERLERLLSFLK